MARCNKFKNHLMVFTIGKNAHRTAYTSFLTVLSPEFVDKV